ncbi:MAG: CRTAC1 family protein [Planctomycetaceae bacterium]|nr:CRTAC1 family protein [Planctomycetaceae bacterium]
MRFLIPLFLVASMASAAEPIVFEDATAKTGLGKYLESHPMHRPWRYAHGAGWGDVDGDGRPDLYIGAFAARKWFEGPEAPIPNMLFLNKAEGFSFVDDAAVQASDRNARCAGVLLADLDNDGDLDLLVANHVTSPNHQGSRLLENLGSGKFRDATPTSGDWPGRIGMRNASAIDVNDDGLLDLVIADGSYGKQSEAKARLLVLENKGQFGFAEVSARLGLPQEKTQGLGLAIGDVNQDGRPDVFVAGSNRLFVSRGKDAYQEAHPGRFSMPPADAREGMHCGAALCDLNGDDLLDLVTTEHGVPTRLHVYHNRGVAEGIPDLVHVSESAGLGKLFPPGTRENPIKTTHVALEDMDNDGRPDLFLAVIYRDERGAVQPVVLRNLAEKGGELKFSPPPYDKMFSYYAPAPLADYDRDGRLDVFMASWFENQPNYLFRNATSGGNWLAVRVAGRRPGVNTMGIGAIVRVYEAGGLGDPKRLLGRKDIAIGTGYASTEEARAHFGLGQAKLCDVEVTWGTERIARPAAAENQEISVEVGPSEKR